MLAPGTRSISFFDLYFVGTFLVNGAALFLVFAVLTALNLHYQILHEERYLARVHERAYQTYRDRTARYWTWRGIRRTHGEHTPKERTIG